MAPSIFFIQQLLAHAPGNLEQVASVLVYVEGCVMGKYKE